MERPLFHNNLKKLVLKTTQIVSQMYDTIRGSLYSFWTPPIKVQTFIRVHVSGHSAKMVQF